MKVNDLHEILVYIRLTDMLHVYEKIHVFYNLIGVLPRRTIEL